MAIIGSDIQRAKQLLTEGDLVAIPTETVYGLAGNALDATTVAKIFEVKDRPFFDPIIVHVQNWKQAQQFGRNIPQQAEKLARQFWPGPLTILLSRQEAIPDLVTAGLGRVGLRCPNHPVTLQLLSELSFPLAAPSANPFGYISPTTALHVQDQLGEKIPYILDGGPCEVGIESTIVGWEGKECVIYRLGGLPIEGIQEICGHVVVRNHSSSQPAAPGQVESHYAPRKPFFLGDQRHIMKSQGLNRPALLRFSAPLKGINGLQLILSPTGDMREAAKNLFAMLRELDNSNADAVIAEEVPDIGLGRAINDRLRRAATTPT